MSDTDKKEQQEDKPRFRLPMNQLMLEIIIVVVALGLLLSLIHMRNLREKARRHYCASQLSSIGLSLKQYSMDGKDHFPPKNGAAGLEFLRANSYCTDGKIYVCPSTKTTPSKAELTEDTVDYAFHGGMTESDSADSPIVWDKPGNHSNCGNAVLLNGAVCRFKGADWLTQAQRPDNRKLGKNINKFGPIDQ